MSRDWVVLGGGGGDLGYFWDLGDCAVWSGVRLTPRAQACVANKTCVFPFSLPYLHNSALWAQLGSDPPKGLSDTCPLQLP